MPGGGGPQARSGTPRRSSGPSATQAWPPPAAASPRTVRTSSGGRDANGHPPHAHLRDVVPPVAVQRTNEIGGHAGAARPPPRVLAPPVRRGARRGRGRTAPPRPRPCRRARPRAGPGDTSTAAGAVRLRKHTSAPSRHSSTAPSTANQARASGTGQSLRVACTITPRVPMEPTRRRGHVVAGHGLHGAGPTLHHASVAGREDDLEKRVAHVAVAQPTPCIRGGCEHAPHGGLGAHVGLGPHLAGLRQYVSKPLHRRRRRDRDREVRRAVVDGAVEPRQIQRLGIRPGSAASRARASAHRGERPAPRAGRTQRFRQLVDGRRRKIDRPLLRFLAP